MHIEIKFTVHLQFKDAPPHTVFITFIKPYLVWPFFALFSQPHIFRKKGSQRSLSPKQCGRFIKLIILNGAINYLKNAWTQLIVIRFLKK